MWKEFEEYGVKGRLLRAIRSLYEKSEACVRVKGDMSSWFPITRPRSEAGLCHVTMFNMYLWIKVVRERNGGLYWRSTSEVGLVLFADDVLLTERKEDTETNLREVKSE